MTSVHTLTPARSGISILGLAKPLLQRSSFENRLTSWLGRFATPEKFAKRCPLDPFRAWTWGELRQWTQAYLSHVHRDHAARLSEHLVADVFSGDRLSIYLDPERCVTEPYFWIYRFAKMIERDVAGGFAPQEWNRNTPFAGRSFRVPPEVFEPRPESHHLLTVAQYGARYLYQRLGRRLEVLETCCGSGALGISLALELPTEVGHFHLVDHSMAAVRAAELNIVRHGLERKVRCITGDLIPFHRFLSASTWISSLGLGIPLSILEVLPPYIRWFLAEQCDKLLPKSPGDLRSYYDLLIANPPYFDLAQAPADWKKWGRSQHLRQWYAADHGLAVAFRILEQAQIWGKPSLLLLECGEEQGKPLADFARRLPHYRSSFTIEPSAGFAHVFVASSYPDLDVASLGIPKAVAVPDYLSPRRPNARDDWQRTVRYTARELLHLLQRIASDSTDVRDPLIQLTREEARREQRWHEVAERPESFRIASLMARLAVRFNQAGNPLRYLNPQNLARCELQPLPLESAILMLGLCEALERVLPKIDQNGDTKAQLARRQIRMTLAFLHGEPNEFGHRIGQTALHHCRALQSGLTYYLSLAEPLA